MTLCLYLCRDTYMSDDDTATGCPTLLVTDQESAPSTAYLHAVAATLMDLGSPDQILVLNVDLSKSIGTSQAVCHDGMRYDIEKFVPGMTLEKVRQMAVVWARENIGEWK